MPKGKGREMKGRFAKKFFKKRKKSLQTVDIYFFV